MTKILITGDFCPINRIQGLIERGEYAKIYNDFLPFLRGADIAITNLECPLTMEREKLKKAGPNLKAPEKAIDSLVFAGFNLVTLANNHIMDYGSEGLQSTIDCCKKSNIDFVGVGSELSKAQEPFYKTINDIKFAFINFCENEESTTSGKTPGANPLNPVSNYYAIQKAKAQANYVIVIVHGGHEFYSLPSPRMQETYRFFIDSGASAVVGHHTHCYSGYEIYQDAPIFYSLGNFLFDWNDRRDTTWNLGFALQLEITSNIFSFSLLPYKQGDKQPGLVLLNTSEKEDFEREITRINNIIGNKILLQLQFDKFAEKQKASYKRSLEPYSARFFTALYRRNLLPSLLTSKKKTYF
jgi:poly-gamma-glutamate capsule biosynthesis protein CapA/YwtB (metallophosphatase superfamily)